MKPRARLALFTLAMAMPQYGMGLAGSSAEAWRNERLGFEVPEAVQLPHPWLKNSCTFGTDC